MHLRDQLFRSPCFAPDDVPGTPAVETPPVVPPVETPPVETPPVVVPPVKADWRDGRIAELTGRLAREKEARERAEAAAVPPAGTVPPVVKPGETPEAFEARVTAEATRRAGEIAAASDWNSRCEAVNSEGKKDFPDWTDRLNACKDVVDWNDRTEIVQYNEVLAAAMETGHGHRIIHQLGSDPGEVRRLMGLPPIKRAVAVAQMGGKFTPPPEAPDPSKVGKPITPIGSKGLHYEGITPDDAERGMQLPKDQWMKMREAQVTERGIQ